MVAVFNEENKVLLCGDGGCGKSVFIKRCLGHDFHGSYVATIGVEVHAVHVAGRVLGCWDTAGQDRFAGLRHGYYVNSKCAIVMFDGTSHNSFVNVKKWVSDIYRVCGNIPISVVSNKSDLGPCKSKSKAIAFCTSLTNAGMKASFYEISSKTGEGITDPFTALIATF